MRWVPGAPMVRPRWAVIAMVVATVMLMLAAMVVVGWPAVRTAERATAAAPAPAPSERPDPAVLVGWPADPLLAVRVGECGPALVGGGPAWFGVAAASSSTVVPTAGGWRPELAGTVAPLTPPLNRGPVDYACLGVSPGDFVALAGALGWRPGCWWIRRFADQGLYGQWRNDPSTEVSMVLLQMRCQ